MNLYFLVEGRRTEMKVYPAWLSHLVPSLRRVESPGDLDENCYVIFSGEGYPSLLDIHLHNAIKDYQASRKFSRLVVCLDVDESTPRDRIREVHDKATGFGFPIHELRVIPQNCCIETWFLGNRKVVSPNPQMPELAKCMQFYDVRNEDPELMMMPKEYNSRSVFHARFFQLVSQSKNFKYTKQMPRHVVDKQFLEELVSRTETTRHLETFAAFLDLCREIGSDAGETTNETNC